MFSALTISGLNQSARSQFQSRHWRHVTDQSRRYIWISLSPQFPACPISALSFHLNQQSRDWVGALLLCLTRNWGGWQISICKAIQGLPNPWFTFVIWTSLLSIGPSCVELFTLSGNSILGSQARVLCNQAIQDPFNWKYFESGAFYVQTMHNPYMMVPPWNCLVGTIQGFEFAF